MPLGVPEMQGDRNECPKDGGLVPSDLHIPLKDGLYQAFHRSYLPLAADSPCLCLLLRYLVDNGDACSYMPAETDGQSTRESLRGRTSMPERPVIYLGVLVPLNATPGHNQSWKYPGWPGQLVMSYRTLWLKGETGHRPTSMINITGSVSQLMRPRLDFGVTHITLTKT